MDALEKLDLLEEHADLVTQLQGGGIDALDKLDMLERLAEIIALLGGSATDAPSAEDKRLINGIDLDKIIERLKLDGQIGDSSDSLMTNDDVDYALEQFDKNGQLSGSAHLLKRGFQIIDVLASAKTQHIRDVVYFLNDDYANRFYRSMIIEAFGLGLKINSQRQTWVDAIAEIYAKKGVNRDEFNNYLAQQQKAFQEQKDQRAEQQKAEQDQKAQAELEKKAKEREAMLERQKDIRAWLADADEKTIGRVEKILDEKVNYNSDLFKGVATRKHFIEEAIKKGGMPELGQVHPFTWNGGKFNNMNWREQADYTERYEKLKDEYRLKIPNSDMYHVITKTEFDYANYLIGIGHGDTDTPSAEDGEPQINQEQLASLVQLQGRVELNSLSPDLPYKELSKSIKKVFDEHLKNTDVYCQPLSTAVTLRNSSAKHILNNGATRDKMLLTLKCAALLSTADSSVEIELKTNKPNITAAYLVKTHIELNGKSEKVGLIVQKDDKGEFLYDAYIEIAGKVSGKNKKDLGVPTGEESYDSSFPVLPKSSTDNLSNDSDNVNPMFDKAEIGDIDLVVNIFFEYEFNEFNEKADETKSSSAIAEPTELEKLLDDLRNDVIAVDDIDLDHLAALADNSSEDETLDQIRNILDMELVAKWLQQLDNMAA